MEYVERSYRNIFFSEDLIHFRISVKNTDLDVGVCKECYSEKLVSFTRDIVLKLRSGLEDYIKKDPCFMTALKPHKLKEFAPPVAVDMATAAELAGVGPMAAVAGAFAEHIGKELARFSPEVIIENGGDLFIITTVKRHIGIFAGESPFTGRVAIEVTPELGAIGLCTSSGTVGPSLSFGKADAAIIIARSGALADAAATAVGNIVSLREDTQKGVDLAAKISGVLGAVTIKEDRMAAWGNVKLVPIAQ